jgi:hypothetical protein
MDMITALVHCTDDQLTICERRGCFSPGRGDRQLMAGRYAGHDELVVELFEERGSTAISDALLSAGFVDTVSRTRYR